MRARVALALFPWGVMAVEACGVLACLAQYATVPCCLRACVQRDAPASSLGHVDGREENFLPGPRRPRRGAGAGGGNFLRPDCVPVAHKKPKGAFPLALVCLGHLSSSWARFHHILVPSQGGWSHHSKADQGSLDVCYAFRVPDS